MTRCLAFYRMTRRRALKLRELLGRRPDSEHEMTLNRVAYSIACFVLAATTFGPEAFSGLTVVAAHLTLSLAIFVHILFFPKENHIRRMLALVLDMTGTSLVVHFGG